ncbi:hypothetical protein LTR95_000643 [Oleoguttula sp. CCFEE 5521]
MSETNTDEAVELFRFFDLPSRLRNMIYDFMVAVYVRRRAPNPGPADYAQEVIHRWIYISPALVSHQFANEYKSRNEHICMITTSFFALYATMHWPFMPYRKVTCLEITLQASTYYPAPKAAIVESWGIGLAGNLRDEFLILRTLRIMNARECLVSRELCKVFCKGLGSVTSEALMIVYEAGKLEAQKGQLDDEGSIKCTMFRHVKWVRDRVTCEEA